MARFHPLLRLNDRYELREHLGTGGMATVWAGHDLTLDRPVAIKEVSAEAQPWWPGALAEAQAAARLNHPNITAVYDYGEIGWPDGTTTAYLVMELVRGQTLADRLVGGPLPWPQAATIAAEVAGALAAAHAHGIVHRDVKPANIMLTPTGTKLLDFGIAGRTGRGESAPLMGTPAYAAPEQLHNHRPGPAADVYSLAVTLVEALHGANPWPAQTWDQARHQAQHRPLPPLAGVPGPAASLLAACLLPEPGQRPTAAQLAGHVTAYRPGPGAAPTMVQPPVRPLTPTLVTPVGSGLRGSAVVGPPPAAPTQIGYREPGSRSRPLRVIIPAVVIAAILLAIGGYAILNTGTRTPLSAAPTTGPTATAPAAPTEASPSTESTPAVSSDQVPVLLAALRQQVEAAIDSGGIDGDRADELRHALRDLTKKWRPGKRGDFIDKAQELRDKIGEAADDGAIPAAMSQSLDTTIAQLIAAAS